MRPEPGSTLQAQCGARTRKPPENTSSRNCVQDTRSRWPRFLRRGCCGRVCAGRLRAATRAPVVPVYVGARLRPRPAADACDSRETQLGGRCVGCSGMACTSWTTRVCWTRWSSWTLESPPLRSSGDVRCRRFWLWGRKGGDENYTGQVREKIAPTWSRMRAVPGFALHFWSHAEDALG